MYTKAIKKFRAAFKKKRGTDSGLMMSGLCESMKKTDNASVKEQSRQRIEIFSSPSVIKHVSLDAPYVRTYVLYVEEGGKHGRSRRFGPVVSTAAGMDEYVFAHSVVGDTRHGLPHFDSRESKQRRPRIEVSCAAQTRPTL